MPREQLHALASGRSTTDGINFIAVDPLIRDWMRDRSIPPVDARPPEQHRCETPLPFFGADNIVGHLERIALTHAMRGEGGAQTKDARRQYTAACLNVDALTYSIPAGRRPLQDELRQVFLLSDRVETFVHVCSVDGNGLPLLFRRVEADLFQQPFQDRMQPASTDVLR